MGAISGQSQSLFKAPIELNQIDIPWSMLVVNSALLKCYNIAWHLCSSDFKRRKKKVYLMPGRWWKCLSKLVRFQSFKVKLHLIYAFLKALYSVPHFLNSIIISKQQLIWNLLLIKMMAYIYACIFVFRYIKYFKLILTFIYSTDSIFLIRTRGKIYQFLFSVMAWICKT